MRDIIRALNSPSTPPGARLSLHLHVCPPDRRARDLSNLPKALEDALTHAGVWADVPALTEELLSRGWTLVMAQKSPEEGYGSFTYVRSPTGFLLEPVALANKPRMERWFETGVLG